MSHCSHLPDEADEAVRRFIRRHRRGLRLCLLGGLFLVLLTGIVVAWALYRGALHARNWLADRGALSFPLQWEQQVGEAALAQMRNQTRFIADSRVTGPLNQLAVPLLTNRTSWPGRFSLFVADQPEINACALPGGFIILNRGLLERARTAEEIQGVVAHEMAHVIKQHGILLMIQNLGLQMVIQKNDGNENAMQKTLVRDSAQLLGLKFSRDHERTADDLGWDLLQKAGINPQGMTDFFASMKKEMDSKGPDGFVLGAGLLSTHPTPQERIDRLQQKQVSIATREFTSHGADFAALRKGLGLQGDAP
jgi:predicted Zn-dependent protease